MSNPAAVMSPAPAPRAVEIVPAVEVEELRKDFWRRNKNRNRFGAAALTCMAAVALAGAASPASAHGDEPAQTAADLHAPFVSIPNAGHLAPLTYPGAVARAIDAAAGR